jgi:uncharacterized protein YlxW (UPF0749 family)
MSEKTELSREEYQQLFQYYRNKAVELELEYLLLQMTNKASVDFHKTKNEKLLAEKDKYYIDLIKKETDSFEETKKTLKIEIEKLNKKIINSKTTNKKT